MGLSLIPWAISGVLLVAAGIYVAHCEQVKRNHATFVSELRKQAKEQEQHNKDTADKQKQAKEKADADTQRNLDNLHGTIKRLRDERARASSVPAAPAGSAKPDLACFDRGEFARAVDSFEARMESLASEGSEATIALDAAKGWALKLSTELKSGG